ncbi:MAG: methyltransferase domain-containing protein [Bacteroidota bacterium]
MPQYNKYYRNENFFGDPYPELMDYIVRQKRGKVLDLGCGQGRDAIALARLGFEVTGVDSSGIGVNQMVQVAKNENLPLTGSIADIFEFNNLDGYSYILLDSMFHFAKKDKLKEVRFIKKLILSMNPEAQIIVCIQDSGSRVKILREIINQSNASILFEDKFIYSFIDKVSRHTSKTHYQMMVVSQ